MKVKQYSLFLYALLLLTMNFASVYGANFMEGAEEQLEKEAFGEGALEGLSEESAQKAEGVMEDINKQLQDPNVSQEEKANLRKKAQHLKESVSDFSSLGKMDDFNSMLDDSMNSFDKNPDADSTEIRNNIKADASVEGKSYQDVKTDKVNLDNEREKLEKLKNNPKSTKAEIEEQEKKVDEARIKLQKVEPKSSLETVRDKWENFKNDIAESKVGKIASFVDDIADKTGLKFVTHTLVSAVLFMIPNVIQSSIENEQRRAAELKSLASPQKYGNWVVQMVKNAINSENPSSSYPLYMMLPVNNPDASISQEVNTMFGGHISGPAGDPDLDNISRYTLNDQYLYSANGRSGRFVLSYPSQSYNDIGASPITGAQFEGLLIDMNHGYVMDATGERYIISGSDVAPPLIPMKANAPKDSYGKPVQSVQESLPEVLEKMTTIGLTYSFNEHGGFGQTLENASGVSALTKSNNMLHQGIKGILTNLFNCTKNSNSDDGNNLCLLNNALQKYQKGIDFGVYTDLLPMYGWGQDAGWGNPNASGNIIKKVYFPTGAPKSSLEQAQESGGDISFGKVSDTGKVEKNTEVAVDVSKSFGSPNEYTEAEGCWVYISTDTPFAKQLQAAAKAKGIGSTSLYSSHTGPYVDYVICLNDEFQQVPLMVPVEGFAPGTKDAGWTTLGKNPNAKYIASLISTSMEQFKLSAQGEEFIVCYDDQGQAKSTPSDKGQTILSAVQSAIANIKSGFPELYNQFTVHHDAMMSLFLSGPFDYKIAESTGSEQSVGLTESADYSVQIGSSNVAVYHAEDLNCYGTSGVTGVADLLLPMSSNTTVVLPSDQVTHFVSLVTDITYQIGKDGVLSASRVTDFQYAPGSWNGTSFTPDDTKKSNYAYLGMIAKSAGKGNTQMEKLEAYVQTQREAWINTLEGKPHAAEQKGLRYQIPALLKKQALDAAQCYVYSVTPSPSADITHKDWFIGVPSQSPSFATLQMVDMLSDSSQAQSLVSLVTGMVYDMDGNPRNTSAGNTMFFKTPAANSQESTAEYLFEYFTGKAYDDALTDQFVQTYHEAIEVYSEDANRPIKQGTYGDISLAIYASDMASGNYIYMNAQGMGSQKFIPKDMYITFDFDSKGTPVLGKELTEGTKNLLSLVTGHVYKRESGLAGSVSMSLVTSYVQTHSPYWRRWLATTLSSLQAAYVDQKAEEKKEQDALDQASQSKGQKVTLTQLQAQAVIKRLGGFLPQPYATLKQDQLTQKFVHLSPANPNNPNEFIYMFFDVPNSYETSSGGSIMVGGIYTEQGQLLQEIQGAALEAMKNQFGLSGKAQKTLGVPVQQPSMLLDVADTKLELGAGKDGDLLISSTSDAFPGPKIKMPQGYYLYYNAKMNQYYVFDVKKERWVSVVGGNVYNRAGQPIPLQQSVAVNSSKNALEDDIILLELNNGGYMQGTMKDQNADNKFITFTNRGAGTWDSAAGSATVQEATSSKGDEYKIMFSHNDTQLYTVDSDYAWESLIYLPLTKDKTLLSQAQRPSAKLQECKLVKNKDEVTYIMFNEMMYKVASVESDSYVMTPISTKSAASIKVVLEVDTQTNAPYIVITTSKGNTYRYGYIYEQLDKAQQDMYSSQVFKGTVTTCPASIPVRKTVQKPHVTVQDLGSDDSASQITGKRNVVVENKPHNLPDTHVLFVPNITVESLQDVQVANVIGAPSQDSGLYSNFANTLFRVKQDKNGRFFAQLFKNDGNSVHEPFIKYFDRAGYVDLQTGALFDNGGRSLGISLQLNDWLDVLNTLNVTVNYNQKGITSLFFRNAATIKVQLQQQSQMQVPSVDNNDQAQSDLVKQSKEPQVTISSKSSLPNIDSSQNMNSSSKQSYARPIANELPPQMRNQGDNSGSIRTQPRKIVGPGIYGS